ncbi:hydrogen peroxide stress regulator 1-like [Homarus americanus]|uniref:hydrogen peroxide stress regulator 1-like n=1 Tax=Homarus americanus TaxID=6706 RepID=UPI001C43C415|nr:hydrogen peroxide stress regulator 1-like [Homarus americanus]
MTNQRVKISAVIKCKHNTGVGGELEYPAQGRREAGRPSHPTPFLSPANIPRRIGSSTRKLAPGKRCAGGVGLGLTVTSELLAAMAEARETLAHYPEDANFLSLCSDSPAPTPNYSHAAANTVTVNSLLQSTNETVGGSLNYGVNGLQYSNASPAGHQSASSSPYPSMSPAGHASSGSPAYSMSSAGHAANDLNNLNFHSSFSVSNSDGVETVSPEFYVYGQSQYQGTSGYQTAILSQEHRQSLYDQVMSAPQPPSYYGHSSSTYSPSGSIVSDNSNNKSPKPVNDQLPPVKRRRVNSSSSSDDVDKIQHPSFQSRQGNARDRSSSTPSPKVPLPPIFTPPNLNSRSDSSVPNSGSLPPFKHPYAASYSYDISRISAATSLQRTEENTSLQTLNLSYSNNYGLTGDDPVPPYHQYLSHAPLPSFSTISPQLNPSSQTPVGESPPLPTLSGIPQFTAYSSGPSHHLPAFSSHSALPPFTTLPSTSSMSSASLGVPSISGSQMVQIVPVNLTQKMNNGAKLNISNTPSQMNQPRASRSFSPGLEATCPHCIVTFASSGHLKRHLESHGSNRRFKCPGCNCAYSRQDNLKKHIASAHTKDDEKKTSDNTSGNSICRGC